MRLAKYANVFTPILLTWKKKSKGHMGEDQQS